MGQVVNKEGNQYYIRGVQYKAKVAVESDTKEYRVD